MYIIFVLFFIQLKEVTLFSYFILLTSFDHK